MSKPFTVTRATNAQLASLTPNGERLIVNMETLELMVEGEEGGRFYLIRNRQSATFSFDDETTWKGCTITTTVSSDGKAVTDTAKLTSSGATIATRTVSINADGSVGTVVTISGDASNSYTKTERLNADGSVTVTVN